MIVLNVPIFLVGLRREGAVFTVYSLFTVAVYSLMSFLIMEVLPIDVSFLSPLAGSDLLLCAIFGGVISGIGSGLTIRFGGAIDGIDVLSVMFAKKIGISIGSKTVDFVVEGIDKSKCAMIVTTKADTISDALTENFQSSGTIVKAVGGYSKENKDIIYFIMNHFQINKLKKIVHDIDPTAFISLHEVSDIIKKSDR